MTKMKGDIRMMNLRKHFFIPFLIAFAFAANASASTPPNRPTLTSPAHNPGWLDDQALNEGSITFTWINNGDAENNPLRFYFSLMKWNGSAWSIDISTFTSPQGAVTITRNLLQGYYIWQVAAVDATMSSNPYYSWADRNGDGSVTSADWMLLRVAAPVVSSGKIVAHWRGGGNELTSSEFQANKDAMANLTTFTGTIVDVKTNSDVGVKTNLFRPSFVLTRPNLDTAVGHFISGGGVGQFTHILLNTHLTRGSQPKMVRWFEDWTQILSNINVLADAAGDAGIKGILLDMETYGACDTVLDGPITRSCPDHPTFGKTRVGHAFNTWNLQNYYPGCDSKCDNAGDVCGNCAGNLTCERNCWKPQVKARCKDIAEEIVSAFPNARLAYRQSLNYVKQFENGGGDLSIAGSNAFELLPACINGFLEGIGTGDVLAIMYEGAEFKKGDPPLSKIQALWDLVKPSTQGGILANDANYIETGNKTLYNSKHRHGLGLWSDACESTSQACDQASNNNAPWSNVTGTGNKANCGWISESTTCSGGQCTYDCNTNTPVDIKNFITNGLSSSFGFDVITIYTDTDPPNWPNWWGSPGINIDYRQKLKDAYNP